MSSVRHPLPLPPPTKRQLLLNQPYIIDDEGSLDNFARNVIHPPRGLKH